MFSHRHLQKDRKHLSWRNVCRQFFFFSLKTCDRERLLKILVLFFCWKTFSRCGLNTCHRYICFVDIWSNTDVSGHIKVSNTRGNYFSAVFNQSRSFNQIIWTTLYSVLYVETPDEYESSWDDWWERKEEKQCSDTNLFWVFVVFPLILDCFLTYWIISTFIKMKPREILTEGLVELLTTHRQMKFHLIMLLFAKRHRTKSWKTSYFIFNRVLTHKDTMAHLWQLHKCIFPQYLTFLKYFFTMYYNVIHCILQFMGKNHMFSYL